MQTKSGLTIHNETVTLDGTHFVGCTITGCVLEYAGQAVIFEETTFSKCRFLFTEEAGRTVAFLRSFGIIVAPFDQIALPLSNVN